VAGILSDYRRTIAGFNRNVKLILFYYLLGAVGNGITGVLWNLYFLKAGMDEAFLGTMVFVQNLALALAVVPVGFLADRLHKERLIKAGSLIWAAAFSLIVVSRDQKLILALEALHGLGIAIAIASEFPYLSENTKPEVRTHLFSITMIIFTGVSSLAMLLGGYLPKLFSYILGVPPESAATYRISLFVSVLCFWSAAVVTLFLKRAPRLKVKPKKFAFKISTDPRIILALCAHAGMISFGASLFVPFMNVILNIRFEIPSHIIGWLFMAESLAISFGSFIVPKISQNRGKVTTAVILQSLSLPLMLIMAYASQTYLFVISFIFRAALMNMANPLIDSYTMEAIENTERGTVNGLLNLVRNSFFAMGGKLGGMWLKEKMFSLPILVSVCCYATALGVFFALLRNYRRVPSMRERRPEYEIPNS